MIQESMVSLCSVFLTVHSHILSSHHNRPLCYPWFKDTCHLGIGSSNRKCLPTPCDSTTCCLQPRPFYCRQPPVPTPAPPSHSNTRSRSKRVYSSVIQKSYF